MQGILSRTWRMGEKTDQDRHQCQWDEYVQAAQVKKGHEVTRKKKRLVRKPNITSLWVTVLYSKILSSHLLPGLISELYRVLRRSRRISESSELITFVAAFKHSLWYRRHDIIIYVLSSRPFLPMDSFSWSLICLAHRSYICC